MKLLLLIIVAAAIYANLAEEDECKDKPKKRK